MSRAEVFLARLVGVKQTGERRWMARCPAHEDNSPSLSVRELDDGRILIHDFGGCEPGDVMQAVGLGLTDLFAGPLTHHAPPIRRGFTHQELLMSLSHETFVAALILEAARDSYLTEEAERRLDLAISRIGMARALANG